MPASSGIEYLGLSRIQCALVFVGGIRVVGFREMAELVDSTGLYTAGRVLAVPEDMAVVEVFDGTVELSATRSVVRFLGRGFEYTVSADEVLGRVFDGLGRPPHGRHPPGHQRASHQC